MSVPRMLEVVRKHRAAISNEDGEFVFACHDPELREEIPHRYNHHIPLVEALTDLLDPKIDIYPCQAGSVRQCKCRSCSTNRARVTLEAVLLQRTIVLRQNRR